MQASTPTPGGPDGTGRACDQCNTQNAAAARFCKQCGSALVAPPTCPFCQAPVTSDARFCSSCGTKLVGARPTQRAGEARSTRVADELERTKKEDAPTATKVAAAAEVEALAANLPKRRPSSNMLTNVLMFVAALAIFVVIMYAVNKDAPKSTSPFQGPPAMEQMRGTQVPPVAMQPPPAAANNAAPAEGGAPIRGTITLDPKLAAQAPTGGSVFVFARNQGMPDRGPPVAVLKVDHPSFPLAFEIGPANVMMGMPFTGPFDLYVRLDGDGNAMTKEAGDLMLSSPKSGVSPGQSGVEIVLDKRL
jgi:hypothetical protein